METADLGLSHGTDAQPLDGAKTRCGLTVGNGVVAFGPMWKRVQVDVVSKGHTGIGPACETCFPLPDLLKCPCCDRLVTREQYDLAIAELAKAATQATIEGRP